MTSFASTLIRQAREEIKVVNDWLSVELARERNARILAEAEERRLVRLAPRRSVWTAMRARRLARLVPGGERPSMRARAARRLFGFAVALEREETWRVVWERLEAPRQP
jgi:hypothetical protein